MPSIGEWNVEHAQFGGTFNSSDGAHGLLGAAHVAAPARRFLLHQPQPPRHIHSGNIQRSHFRRIQFNPDFAIGPADAFDRTEARHAQQAFGDRVIDKPAEFLIVKTAVRICTRGQGEYRATGGGNLGHRRFPQFAGQIGAYLRHRVTHIIDRIRERFLQDKFDRYGHHAVEHLGENVFNALQTGYRVFDLARHVGFELGRGRAGQRGAHGDYRQFNVGKILYLVAAIGKEAGQRQ